MGNKVTIIGAGSVGASIANDMVAMNIATEIVLIDVNEQKAFGEAMDIYQGVSFCSPAIVRPGQYADAAGSSVVIITSGVARKPGQSRLELAQVNVDVLKEITPNIVKYAPDAIYIMVSNPVDVMTYVFHKISGIPANRIIGSGTVLDTARLRHALSEFLGFADSNIHAYIMGEHGDSSFVPWIHSYIGCKSLLEYLDENDISLMELQNIYIDVRDKAYKIIDLKRATYYGIGYALKRIVDAVLNNEHCILPVSSYQNGEYDRTGLFIGTPTVIGSRGVERVMSLPLNENDQARFNKSFDTLEATIRENLGDIIDLD